MTLSEKPLFTSEGYSYYPTSSRLLLNPRLRTQRCDVSTKVTTFCSQLFVLWINCGIKFLLASEHAYSQSVA